MDDLAGEFARFADVFADALLLVAGGGQIHAVNSAARDMLFGGLYPAARQPIGDFVADPPEKVLDYLKICSRSAQRLPGTLLFGDEKYHCVGSSFRTGGGNARPLVVLRVVPRQESVSRFVNLNQRIQELTTEIGRRHLAERTAEEQRELLRTTLASIGDAVMTTDARGRITFMNSVAERLTRWSETEALGLPLDDVFVIQNEDTGATVESPVAKVLRHGLVVGLANHTVLVTKDGDAVPIDDSGAPIADAQGRLLGVVLVFHEISERRRMERELKRQAEALREADRRKDEFLAMLAHELRNPLAPLHNAVQILRLQGSSADIDRLADMMERQTSQLTRLVDDLLDIARITRGTIRLDRRPVALARVIEHAVETTRPLLEARGHRLDVRLPPESLVVHADLARLSQALCNLLNNAGKFMEPGGTVTLTGLASGGEAVIRVRDEGQGIEPELLTSIFDVFTQDDRSLDRQEGGLGIGLTVVKTLVQMHGGEVSAFSEGRGKGSEFVVSLPTP